MKQQTFSLSPSRLTLNSLLSQSGALPSLVGASPSWSIHEPPNVAKPKIHEEQVAFLHRILSEALAITDGRIDESMDDDRSVDEEPVAPFSSQ